MDLDPGSPVKAHQFEELCMIGQFIDTAAKYIRVGCVDEHKLIRM
jgi:imidazole glycerol phosphate synthase subunit HisF